jgi:uncharacterized membrane protein
MYKLSDIKPEKKDSNLLAALAYIGNFGLGIVAPLLIYILVKDDRYVRFHALHSIFFLLLLMCLNIIIFPIFFLAMFLTRTSVIFFILFPTLFAINVLPLLYFAYSAYRARRFSSPHFITRLALEHL